MIPTRLTSPPVPSLTLLDSGTPDLGDELASDELDTDELDEKDSGDDKLVDGSELPDDSLNSTRPAVVRGLLLREAKSADELL
jgi:hypothetical protein